jgi:hypothetical protein
MVRYMEITQLNLGKKVFLEEKDEEGSSDDVCSGYAV